jgi:hypothetical protein
MIGGKGKAPAGVTGALLDCSRKVPRASILAVGAFVGTLKAPRCLYSANLHPEQQFSCRCRTHHLARIDALQMVGFFGYGRKRLEGLRTCGRAASDAESPDRWYLESDAKRMASACQDLAVNAGLETRKSNRGSRQEGKSSGVVLRTGGNGLHPCAHLDFNRPLRPERLTAS